VEPGQVEAGPERCPGFGPEPQDLALASTRTWIVRSVASVTCSDHACWSQSSEARMIRSASARSRSTGAV
jgi:hypothetical protein